jgi:hypothetical protein
VLEFQYICLPYNPPVLDDASEVNMLVDSWAQVVAEVLAVRELGLDPAVLANSVELCYAE